MRPYHERTIPYREQQRRESYRQGWGEDNPDRTDTNVPNKSFRRYPLEVAADALRAEARRRSGDPFKSMLPLTADERRQAGAISQDAEFRVLIAAAWLAATHTERAIIKQVWPHVERSGLYGLIYGEVTA